MTMFIGFFKSCASATGLLLASAGVSGVGMDYQL